MDQEKIGKLIAKLRKSKGLTQRELGDMVGVGYRAVSKWETGLTSPDISIINDLSKILGISADELLKGELSDKELLTKRKLKNKSIPYIIAIMSVVLLSVFIILTNNNKSYVYGVSAYEKKYYIEGELILKNKNISLKINKIGFEDSKFKETVIKNFQYEITCDNILIFGYGYIPIHAALPSPISIENWSNDLIINYNGNISLTRKDIIKKGLNLKITFLDEQNKKIIKNIKIKLKEQEITHST